MKKKISFLALAFIFLMNLAPTAIFAADERILTSDGFFTGYNSAVKSCTAVDQDEASSYFNFMSGPKANEGGGENKEVEEMGFFEEMLTSTLTGFLTWIVDAVSEGICEVEDATGLGLFSQMYIFSEPVNVTNISGLMSVTGMVQWLALTVMIFGILYYGYQVAIGNKEIDPFKFSFRYIGSMFLVYYAPYFVQDILNLNNQIVDTFGSYGIEFAPGVDGVTVVTVLPLAFVGFIQNVGEYATQGGMEAATSVATIVVLLVIVILCLIPMLKLVVWWYIRLFKLFLYTALSPIMFATFALDETSNTGSNFLSGLVKEVFGQFFVVLGLFVTGAFIAQLPDLARDTNMGIIGLGIALYAAINFLNEIPRFAGDMIEGKVGARGEGISGGVGKFTNTLGGKAKNRIGTSFNKNGSGGPVRNAISRAGNQIGRGNLNRTRSYTSTNFRKK